MDRDERFFDFSDDTIELNIFAPSDSKHLIFQSNIYYSQMGLRHRRKNYAMLDFIGELGGVFELLVVFFGFLMYPISRHSFIMMVLSKSFMVQTLPVQLEDLTQA